MRSSVLLWEVEAELNIPGSTVKGVETIRKVAWPAAMWPGPREPWMSDFRWCKIKRLDPKNQQLLPAENLSDHIWSWGFLNDISWVWVVILWAKTSLLNLSHEMFRSHPSTHYLRQRSNASLDSTGDVCQIGEDEVRQKLLQQKEESGEVAGWMRDEQTWWEGR